MILSIHLSWWSDFNTKNNLRHFIFIYLTNACSLFFNVSETVLKWSTFLFLLYYREKEIHPTVTFAHPCLGNCTGFWNPLSCRKSWCYWTPEPPPSRRLASGPHSHKRCERRLQGKFSWHNGVYTAAPPHPAAELGILRPWGWIILQFFLASWFGINCHVLWTTLTRASFPPWLPLRLANAAVRHYS